MSPLFSRKKSTDDSVEKKFDTAFSRSRSRFKEGLLKLFGRQSRIDEAFLEEIEAFL